MKKILLPVLSFVCVCLAAAGVALLLEAGQGTMDAPLLVRIVLAALGIALLLAGAFASGRSFLQLLRREREAQRLDLDELTVEESKSEALPVFLARLIRELETLSRGGDAFLARAAALLKKQETGKAPAGPDGESAAAGAACAEKDALLREMARTLLGAAGREDLFRRVIRMAAGVSRSRRASIMLVNPEHTGLILQEALGWEPDETVRRTLFPLDGCLSGSVVREGKRMLVSDIKTVTGRDNREGYTSSSFIILPFYDNGQVAGVINLTEREESDLYEYDELELLNHLLDLLALVLLRLG